MVRDILLAWGHLLRRLVAPFLLVHPAGPRSSADAQAAAAWQVEDARWYSWGTPPRPGNRVELLVDGQAAMFSIYQAILEAKEYVLLSEWSLSPEIELVRGDDQRLVPPVPGRDGQKSYRLRDLVAYKAARIEVRVLLWQGLLFFRPRRHLVYRAQRILQDAHPAVQVVVDATEPFGNSHHQKFVIVDGRIAFVGGLDLTDFDVDRWDTTAHPLREGRNWHDVVMRLEGPCVTDVHRNFSERWTVAARTACPSPVPLEEMGAVLGQIVRTIPPRTYRFARRGEEGIVHGYREAIAKAERFIYIENQYLWAPEIVDSLVEVIQRRRTTSFQVAIVLPIRPNIGKTDTDRNVRRLLEADRRGGHVHVYGLYSWGRRGRSGQLVYKPTYVHAKLMIVDDVWLTVGSANLNTRSSYSDSELNVVVRDETIVRDLRQRLWSEHMLRPYDEVGERDPVHLLERVWPRLGRAGSHRLRRRRDPLPSRLVSYPLGVVLSGVATQSKDGH